MALPSSGTRLQYIRSNGSQYIDTGIVPTINTKVAATAKTTTTPSNNEWLFGSRAASGSGRFSVFRNSATKKWGFGFNTTTVESFTAPQVCKVDVYVDGNSCTINGVSATASVSTLSSNRSIYLCMENRVGVAEQGFVGDLLTVKIWNGDTLVREYIPWLTEDGVAGLYETVEGVFKPSAGSAAFIAGPPYDPNYIEPVEGHNALIDGTAYAITGGEVLVDGAVYDVAKGKTMVGGTVYTIPFTVPKIAVNITGYGGSGCYATIAGKSYLSAAVLEIDAGTAISVATTPSGSTITVDGKLVATASSNKAAQYTFVPDCAVVNIAFSKPDVMHFAIKITTS